MVIKWLLHKPKLHVLPTIICTVSPCQDGGTTTTQYNESIDVGLSMSELATYFRVTTFARAVRAPVNPLRFFDDPLLTELNVSYS